MPCPQSLAEIVSDYCRDHRPRAECEWPTGLTVLTLDVSSAKPLLSTAPYGKRHPHQRRIPAQVLQHAADKLVHQGIATCQSFDDFIAP